MSEEGTPEYEAASALAQLISDISEDCYCAGWLDGIEYYAWGWVLQNPTEPVEFGMGNVTLEEIAAMKRYSEKCGGWVHYHHHGSDNPAENFVYSGERFVPMDKWLEMYEQRPKR